MDETGMNRPAGGGFMVNHEVLVERLRSEDKGFKKWADLHGRLEDRLQSLSGLKFLTAEEEMEKKRVQKQKLMAKDQMQLILYHYKRLS
jgi:hypothetical protein